MLQSNSPERIVRHVYFDEAGLSQEPYTVVAGIMVHVDNHYRNLQKYILDMADDLLGPDRPLGFLFHAQDLWHGSGFFPRNNWELAKRLEILGHLADIPQKYQCPILYSCVEKKKFPPRDESPEARKAANLKRHTICFLSCLSQTDRFMEQFHSDEMVFVIVEDHAEHRAVLREGAKFLGEPRLREAIERDDGISWRPLTHIVEEPLFQGKSGKSPLQIADICAFILNRHFAGDNYIVPFVEKIMPQLASGLRTDFVTSKTEKVLSGG